MPVIGDPLIQLHPDVSYRDLMALLNENFRRLSESINNPRVIYYNGDIQNENTATTYKVLGPNRELISGITKTNTSTLTVVTKGIYVIQAQQLISAGANAGYFEIRINNTTETYGYYPANSFNDVPVSCMKELDVGDTIRIYQTAAITNSYASAHSNINVFCIKQT